MKFDKALWILCCIGFHYAAPLQAYETDTHALMTFHSFDRSVLAQPDTLQRLGLDRFEALQPFHFPDDVPYTPERDAYFDYQPTLWQQQLIGETFRRKINGYELAQFPLEFRGSVNSAKQLQLKAWLMRGAVREDDLILSSYKEETPPDIDPHGELTRVYHHFYDPIFDQGLSVAFPCSALPGAIPSGCVKSTDWAMGVVDAAGAAPSGPDPSRRNHFSYADALEAEWCALTHRGSNPAGALAAAGARRACWASSIKALGQVLHLLQDTAQPQHVRNDRHNPTSGDWFDDLFATSQARRTYEVWTNYRATLGEISSPSGEEDSFKAFFATQASVPPIQSGNYPKPMFSKAIEFFTTRASDADFRDRRGLADFTNRNVYSEGTIFSNAYNSPPFTSANPGLSFIERTVGSSTLFGTLSVFDVLWDRNDSVQPGFVDPPLQAFGGKIPLLRRSIWTGLPLAGDEGDIIALDQYTTHADMLIPRAISYGAGLIDYFFRGRLEVNSVTAPLGVVGVVDQGVTHTVDAEGYPRRSDGRIFGFEKVRLALRNVSEAIIESGPAAPALAQTSGNGVLVAVARYHRNSCYQPDLSGQRVQHYTPAPPLLIDEPACSVGVQRTDFQEIAVSAPLSVASVADLPGGVGVDDSVLPVDKLFDFSADPIPINATDLFIQVVYRGVLGEAPDGIAVGTLDVREPSFVATYNGSDFRWDGANWVPGVVGTTGTTRGVDFLHVCAGAPSRLIYRRAEFGQTALVFPATGAVPIAPGVVRLGILFTEPASPTSNRVLRHQPTMEPAPSAAPRISVTRGNRRQASKETVAPSILAAPIHCAENGVPATGDYWCNDPILERRGQRFGDIAQPIYYSPVGGNDADIDVDAVPLPDFSGLRLQELGENRFEQDMIPVPCPSQPARTPEEAALLQQWVELQESAWERGIPLVP